MTKSIGGEHPPRWDSSTKLPVLPSPLRLRRTGARAASCLHQLGRSLQDSRIFTEIGEQAGYMSAGLQEDVKPELGPLNARAWITQAILLSQRIFHHTRGRMIWTCETSSQGGDGEDLPMETSTPRARELHERLRSMGWPSSHLEVPTLWMRVVDDYCSRKLTYESVKLIALGDLANGLQKRNPTNHCNGGVG